MKNEKYCDKVENALLYLSKEQVEKYVEIDKRMKLKDFMYGKHNFNRYGMASLAKWLSVRLRTKWFWVRVQLQSLHFQISHLL